MGEKGERAEARKKEEKERERERERKEERIDTMWISLRKAGHHTSTFELCGKAFIFYFMTPVRNMEELGFGEMFK